MNVDYPLVSQTLPQLVDSEVHSGSSGPSNMSNFLPAKHGFKMAELNVNSLVNMLTNLESFLLSFHLIFWQLVKPNLTNP